MPDSPTTNTTPNPEDVIGVLISLYQGLWATVDIPFEVAEQVALANGLTLDQVAEALETIGR